MVSNYPATLKIRIPDDLVNALNMAARARQDIGTKINISNTVRYIIASELRKPDPEPIAAWEQPRGGEIYTIRIQTHLRENAEALADRLDQPSLSTVVLFLLRRWCQNQNLLPGRSHHKRKETV
jgi:hypothetical protein